MKQNISIIFLLFSTLISNAQLGFCGGNSGDPIFVEDFGTGIGNSMLPNGTTTYNYINTFPNDGFYTVSNGSFGNPYDWHEVEDHTPNDTNGKFLIVNAGFSAGEFYRTTVSGLCEATTYEFSAWLFNLIKIPGFCSNQGIEIPLNVSFQIWDSTDTNLLASGNTGDVFGSVEPTWGEYGLVFQTLANQNAVILKMINNGQGGCGNDLAIDDIEFKSCGDTVIVTDPLDNTSTAICNNETPFSITLTATPDFTVFSSHFYQWQESNDGNTWTDLLGETNQTINVSVSATTFYRTKVAEVAVNLNNDQCILLSDVFQVTVNANPNAPVNSGDVPFNCNLNEALLSVSVPADITVNWYDSLSDGILLQANSTAYTATTLGVFYAEAINTITGCVSTSRTAVSAIETLPLAPISNGDVDFNCNLNQAILSVSVPADITVNWYDSLSDGILLQANSTAYTATTLGVFYAEAINTITGCVSTSRTVVNAIETLPLAPISNGDVDFNCNLNQAILSVSVPAGVTVNWYDAVSEGNILQSNSLSYTAMTEGNFYAEAVDNITGCVSSTRAIVNTSIFEPEAPISDGDVSFDCAANEAVLSVSVSTGISVNWYNSQTGGDLLLSDSTTYTVNDLETYYAESVDETTGCISSNRTAVNVSGNLGLENCIIPQGISPGVSPGQNDFFDLSNFLVTKLEIYNRYGTLVYSKIDYNDEWEGQTNDGKELPVGSYFYSMIYDGGTKSRTGWVYINK